MITTITELIEGSIAVKQQLLSSPIPSQIARVAETVRRKILQGGTIYACGNGGSTCDAMHFVEELVARYKKERPGIRAMHFMDPSVLTCWSNDYEFEGAFERQVKTFCTNKDALFLISTSGNSKNICRAAQAAKSLSTYTVALSGNQGGQLTSVVDESLIVPSIHTERIQEAHILIIHILCELLEKD